MYLHSISNNNDNQDIVSMGCNSALITHKVIDNTFDVLAIQTIALMQAIDYLKCHSRLSAATRTMYDEVRSIMPSFTDDKPKYKELQQVRAFLLNRQLTLIF
jgi:histidine ammonia-lyase